MSFFVYDSVIEGQARGQIDFERDDFKVMLVSAAYLPSKRGHATRADINQNEIAGIGYKRGGTPVDVRLSRDSGSDTLDVVLGGAEWEKATINAKGAAYYKSRGGLPVDDELIAYVGFEKTLSAVNGKFALGESVIRYMNRAETV